MNLKMIAKSQNHQAEDEVCEDEPGKLFVGGLSWETTEAKLQQYFSTFGEVVDTIIMKNPDNGQSRGFGFVTFTDADTVPEVLNKGPHLLDGRTIDPKPCNTKAALRKKHAHYPKVFLGGLPYHTTESDVRNAFERFGKVMDVIIMYDHEKNRCKGFGFLSFEDEESLNKCLAQHYVNVNSKKVEVKRAENRDGKSAHSSWFSQNSMGPAIPTFPNWGMSASGYGYGTHGATPFSYAGWVAPPSQWGPHVGYPSYGPQMGAPYWSPINGPHSGHSTTTAGTSSTSAHSVGPNTSGADLYNKTMMTGTTLSSVPKQDYSGYGGYSSDSIYNRNSARALHGINSESYRP